MILVEFRHITGQQLCLIPVYLSQLSLSGSLVNLDVVFQTIYPGLSGTARQNKKKKTKLLRKKGKSSAEK